jgi:hypothetical protein
MTDTPWKCRKTKDKITKPQGPFYGAGAGERFPNFENRAFP